MSAFGKVYSNWVTLYFVVDKKNFKDIYEKLKNILNYEENKLLDIKIVKELQQAQREEFEYAKNYIKLNGYKDKIPKLYFNFSDVNCKKVMKPIIKFGIIHTKGTEGFRKRKPQIVIKISQDMMTKSKRGKKAKVKGLISLDNGENYFTLNPNLFIQSANKLINLFDNKF